jgi:1-acyl-sn-glycerol-3-phosphate acyltransferase
MPFNFLVTQEVRDRVDRLEIPFNEYDYDPYGISKDRLGQFLSLMTFFYRHYFSIKSFGTEHIPTRGRAMIVANHSGGVPADAAMIIASVFLEKEPPRLAQGMVEKFANRLPFVSKWFTEIGQVTGLPENCVNLLENERLLMVYPEGLRGVGKPYSERYELKRFGTGFMRLALETNTPIIPTAYVGGEEAHPTMFTIDWLANLFGIPYWPVPPHLVPIPLPLNCEIYYGEPIQFDGDGSESDKTILNYIREVKLAIKDLIDRGLERRDKNLLLPSGEATIDEKSQRERYEETTKEQT